MAMAEDSVVGRDGALQSTEKGQTPEDEQNIEDAVRTAGKAETGSVRAEDDYYNYVNQKLLAGKQIPEDSESWSYFYELGQESYHNLSELLDEVINQRSNLAEGSPEQKIVDLYQTAMDMEERKRAGFGALQPYLDSIRGAADIQEYIEAVGAVNNDLGFSSLIALAYFEDMKNSQNYGCYLGSADLGPGKETLEDKTQSVLLEAYRNYIKNIMESTGISWKKAEETASDIYKFQTDLAAATLPLSDQNDPEKTYNPLSLEELRTLYSNIDIEAYLKAAGADGFHSWVVNDPGQAKKINSYLTEDHLPLLKEYSIFCLVKDFSPFLTPEIRDSTIAWNNTQKGVQGKKTG
ncbi:peptidase family M13 [Hungatella hathewayi DSM 13479]|uniref:Peptidase family M13 n=1 Tax=Hungatella hathewayi DSM 13479 TaxID=566550 RepID=D3AEZ8_9FIRM|nr:peptidase family M13 [Hungatella hathewayi]EFC99656.1 peptidase family M13 [Hungatella hathewayi DSM 13479]